MVDEKEIQSVGLILNDVAIEKKLDRGYGYGEDGEKKKKSKDSKSLSE